MRPEDNLDLAMAVDLKKIKLKGKERIEYEFFINRQRILITSALLTPKGSILEKIRIDLIREIYEKKLKIIKVLKIMADFKVEEGTEEYEGMKRFKDILINEWRLNKMDRNEDDEELPLDKINAYLNFVSCIVNIDPREYDSIIEDIRTGLKNAERRNFLTRMILRLVYDESIDENFRKKIALLIRGLYYESSHPRK